MTPDIEWPLKPGKAIKTFHETLTDFEKGEILDYKQVWCVGEKCTTKIKGSASHPYNDGYDDDKGDFIVQTDDHIGYRYEIREFLGKGPLG